MKRTVDQPAIITRSRERVLQLLLLQGALALVFLQACGSAETMAPAGVTVESAIATPMEVTAAKEAQQKGFEYPAVPPLAQAALNYLIVRPMNDTSLFWDKENRQNALEALNAHNIVDPEGELRRDFTQFSITDFELDLLYDNVTVNIAAQTADGFSVPMEVDISGGAHGLVSDFFILVTDGTTQEQSRYKVGFYSEGLQENGIYRVNLNGRTYLFTGANVGVLAPMYNRSDAAGENTFSDLLTSGLDIQIVEVVQDAGGNDTDQTKPLSEVKLKELLTRLSQLRALFTFGKQNLAAAALEYAQQNMATR